MLVELRELAGQDNPELRPHFISQTGVALGLRCLTFQRVHLARDFFKDVIHAREILLRIFETGFRKPLFCLEFRDARGFLDDRPAVRWPAAQDLSDTSLLNQCVGFRTQSSSHEKFLNVSEPAEFSIQQIFAVPGTEQPPRDNNFTCTETLGKFSTSDF